jgi:hypothetical protein
MIDRTEQKRLLRIFHCAKVLYDYERIQHSAAQSAYAHPERRMMRLKQHESQRAARRVRIEKFKAQTKDILMRSVLYSSLSIYAIVY